MYLWTIFGSGILLVILTEERELALLEPEEKYMSDSPEADNVSCPESADELAASSNIFLTWTCLFSLTESKLKHNIDFIS